MRIGTGFDVHRLTENRLLILGGVEIPYYLGLLGHSDADVLCHAIADSLLGAAALGDIGQHFPDTEERFKDISGLWLLQQCLALLKQNNLSVVNIDSTIIAQKPKIAPYIPHMRQNIAEALETDISSISVKATTTEALGFTGRGEGLAAQAICLLKPIKSLPFIDFIGD